MAAGFPSLCDNHINATLNGVARFLSRAHRVEHYGAGSLRTGNEDRRVAPEQGDYRHSFLQTGVEALFLRKLQIQINGEWFPGLAAISCAIVPTRRQQTPKAISMPCHSGPG